MMNSIISISVRLSSKIGDSIILLEDERSQGCFFSYRNVGIHNLIKPTFQF